MDGESRATVTPTVGDKPKRQPNFSPTDIEVLVNSVEEEKAVIFGSFVGSAHKYMSGKNKYGQFSAVTKQLPLCEISYIQEAIHQVWA